MQDDIEYGGNTFFKVTYLFFPCWGGEFVTNGEGEVKYNGGSVRVKSIKEGMTVEELRVIIGQWVGINGHGCDIKYTLSCDENILVDMIDDYEMENLFNYNERSAHVYVGCKGTDIARKEMDDQERYVTVSLVREVIMSYRVVGNMLIKLVIIYVGLINS